MFVTVLPGGAGLKSAAPVPHNGFFCKMRNNPTNALNSEKQKKEAQFAHKLCL